MWLCSLPVLWRIFAAPVLLEIEYLLDGHWIAVQLSRSHTESWLANITLLELLSDFLCKSVDTLLRSRL
jgi:hypothetical protein